MVELKKSRGSACMKKMLWMMLNVTKSTARLDERWICVVERTIGSDSLIILQL